MSNFLVKYLGIFTLMFKSKTIFFLMILHISTVLLPFMAWMFHDSKVLYYIGTLEFLLLIITQGGFLHLFAHEDISNPKIYPKFYLRYLLRMGKYYFCIALYLAIIYSIIIYTGGNYKNTDMILFLIFVGLHWFVLNNWIEVYAIEAAISKNTGVWQSFKLVLPNFITSRIKALQVAEHNCKYYIDEMQLIKDDEIPRGNFMDNLLPIKLRVKYWNYGIISLIHWFFFMICCLIPPSPDKQILIINNLLQGNFENNVIYHICITSIVFVFLPILYRNCIKEYFYG